MQKATEDIQPINTQQELQSYINGLISDGAPRFKMIAESSFAYQTTKTNIENRLGESIQYLLDKTKAFEMCHDVYAFMQSFDFDEFAKEHTEVKPIHELFTKLQEWDTNIAKYVKPQVESGLIQINGRNLRELLTTRVKSEQTNLRKHLFGLAIAQNNEILRSLDEIEKSISIVPKTLKEYVDFVKQVGNAKEILSELEKDKVVLESMKGVLGKNRIKDDSFNAGGTNQI